MAVIKHAVLTLTGSAQNPASAIGDTDIIKTLYLSAGPANANPIYIGGADGAAAVSDSNYGPRIEAPTDSIPDAPIVFEGVNLSLGNFRVIGTAGEKLHILSVAPA